MPVGYRRGSFPVAGKVVLAWAPEDVERFGRSGCAGPRLPVRVPIRGRCETGWASGSIDTSFPRKAGSSCNRFVGRDAKFRTPEWFLSEANCKDRPQMVRPCSQPARVIIGRATITRSAIQRKSRPAANCSANVREDSALRQTRMIREDCSGRVKAWGMTMCRG